MVETRGLTLATYLTLGIRNLWRNPRRTGLTLASLIVGIAGLTFLSAMNTGWLREMQSNFILTLNGHVQVHASGFGLTQDLQRRIDDPVALASIIERDPEVMAWSPRVRVSGLAVKAGGASIGVQIMAVDPVREPYVTRLRDCIEHGQWLQANDPGGVLLGSTLAQQIGATVGDKLILMAQLPSGEMASEVFYLRGILCRGAAQVDRTLAMVNLAMAQRWLDLGTDVTDLVLRGDSHDATDGIHRRLVEAFSKQAIDVTRWQDLDPVVLQWLRFSEAYSLVIIFVVIMLVIVEVLNTMLMALHERAWEVGLMGALGTRRPQVFGMLLLESVLLVMIGAIIGFVVGVFTVLYFSVTGIDLTAFSNAFSFFYMSPVIRPVLTADTAVRIIGTTLATALLSGLYPAWRATQLEPIAALRRF